MKVSVDLCVIPIGVGLSLSKYIAECEKVLAKYDLNCQLHAYGTNIEGEWDTVFGAIKQCHEHLHALGVVRLHTSIKCGTRTDKTQKLDDKINSVKKLL
jgi:uncharacterized protein (TIGR00106 family)